MYTNEKMEKIKDTQKILICSIYEQVMNGIDSIDTDEFGKVIDMVKDIAQTERNCYEAEYYKTVIEAMDSKTAIKPYVNQMPYIDKYLDNGNYMKSVTYDKYNSAKSEYSATKSANDKAHMDNYAIEYLMEVTEIIREMYHTSDSELRKKMKSELVSFLNDLM